MSVIVELTVPADAFELGRILTVEGQTGVVLETMVPLSKQSVPFFSLTESARDAFEKQVRSHPSVHGIHVVNTHDGETLYALDWAVSSDAFFEAVLANQGSILDAKGDMRSWAFQLRFESHGDLSGFQESCTAADISVEIERLYNPTKPDAGPWYGLTQPQREALTRAVDGGYYSIPRQMSTADLAAEFDISDQAVTERLRRAIISLVANTLLLSENSD
jgi:predicted DNA binding protein